MRQILKGATDQSVVIRIVDSGDGTPETGVTSATSGLDLKYRREGAATANLTESDLSALTDAHSDGGMLHIGAGYYRIDVPDAAFATGANGVLIFGTVTGMVVIGCYVHLVDYDPQNAVRLGLTALPNAAADAAGGLPISDAGGLDLDAQIGTDIDALIARLTAARAGYLDNLNVGGAVASAAKLLSYFQSALRKDVTVDADIGGTYDDATDSQEAIRDRGDGAWSTATGFSTHTAADVWAVGTRTLTSFGSLVSDIWAAVTDSPGVTTLLSRIPSGIFTGMTSLAQWLGLIAGKQTGNSTARTELRATGAGSGTYDETTDSQEAIRDNMGTPQTGDSFARLGAPAGANVSADIAAVKTDTGNLVTRITSTLFAGMTSLAEWLGLMAGKQTGNSTARTEIRATGGGSGTFDETTDSQEAIRDNQQPAAAAALTAYDPPTRTEATSDKDEILTEISGLENLSQAQAQAAAQAALEANHLDHLLAVDYDPQNKPGHAGALLNEMVESDNSSPGRARFTAGALEEAPTGTGSGGECPTAEEIADEVETRSLTVGTVTDKTGYSLSSAGIQAIWDALTSALTTAGSIGKLLVDNINATISSRSSHSAADVWAVGTRTLTSFGTLVSDIWSAGTRTLTAFDASFKTGYALSSAGVQAIWDALTSALTTVGSIGKLLVDRIDAAISSRSTVTQAEVNAEVDQALADVGLTTTVTGRVDVPVSTRATPAQVNAEVVDALATDTYGEPAATPAATSSLKDKLGWLFLLSRNKQTLNKDTGLGVVRNDADSADVATRTDSDDNTTYTKGEWG